MKVLQPGTQHKDPVHKLYDALQEKIGSQQEIPQVQMDLDYLDSPLMSVPTPAPYHM